MAREAVTQHVWVQLVTAKLQHCEALEALLHRARSDANAPAAGEERSVEREARTGTRHRSGACQRCIPGCKASLQPALQRRNALAPEWDLTHLAALAANPYESLAEIEIAHVGAGQLSEAQTAAVKQFGDGKIANLIRTFGRPSQKLCSLISIQQAW